MSPASRLKLEVARILQNEGYIRGFKLLKSTADAGRQVQATIHLILKYGPRGGAGHLGPTAGEPARPPRVFRPR